MFCTEYANQPLLSTRVTRNCLYDIPGRKLAVWKKKKKKRRVFEDYLYELSGAFVSSLSDVFKPLSKLSDLIVDADRI